jgi:hypothetical protein
MKLDLKQELCIPALFFLTKIKSASVFQPNAVLTYLLDAL